MSIISQPGSKSKKKIQNNSKFFDFFDFYHNIGQSRPILAVVITQNFAVFGLFRPDKMIFIGKLYFFQPPSLVL